ncbi:unnamed protein product [Caenorhabditis auriculariae]|uniref:Secreted protein n=1 Tax=Caenorhabditis auriculariae TaxID=2777116 RepID=A0A8S1H6Q4_9PELO|nr:unnamed protein product [Caenorhabditis auriculariae]
MLLGLLLQNLYLFPTSGIFLFFKPPAKTAHQLDNPVYRINLLKKGESGTDRRNSSISHDLNTNQRKKGRKLRVAIGIKKNTIHPDDFN